MKLRRLILPLALLLVLALVAWRLVRGVSSAPEAPRSSSAARADAAPSGTPSPPGGVPAPLQAAPSGAAGEPRAAAGEPRAPERATAAAGQRLPEVTPTSAPLPPGAGSSVAASGSAAATTAAKPEGLRDRTGGWGQAIVGQLNKELMPLASECIDQATARTPKLEGTLALDLVVVPVDAKRAIIESVTPSPYNQIKDDELVECIRQSSFAMEGLGAPYNFTLSMPIKP